MARVAWLVPIFGIVLIFFIFTPAPQNNTKKESQFIYANPLISKAVLGNFCAISADLAWLESTKIGEFSRGGSQKVDKKEMELAFMTIASLDPSFYHAINYGVSYLSTIAKDKEATYRILDRALLFRPSEFRYNHLKLLIEMTSENPNKQLLKELALKVYANEGFNGVFGAMKVDDFLIDVLAFSTNEEAKKDELKSELEWLMKNTKTKEKKELIAKRLREL